MNSAGLAMIDADSIGAVLGRPVHELVVPEQRESFVRLNEQVLAGESGTLEFEVVGLKGTRRWLETHAVPLRDKFRKGRVVARHQSRRDGAQTGGARPPQRAHPEPDPDRCPALPVGPDPVSQPDDPRGEPPGAGERRRDRHAMLQGVRTGGR